MATDAGGTQTPPRGRNEVSPLPQAGEGFAGVRLRSTVARGALAGGFVFSNLSFSRSSAGGPEPDASSASFLGRFLAQEQVPAAPSPDPTPTSKRNSSGRDPTVILWPRNPLPYGASESKAGGKLLPSGPEQAQLCEAAQPRSWVPTVPPQTLGAAPCHAQVPKSGPPAHLLEVLLLSVVRRQGGSRHWKGPGDPYWL